MTKEKKNPVFFIFWNLKMQLQFVKLRKRTVVNLILYTA